MADVASILAEFQAGLEGKDTGLGATVKFDFEGTGCIFLDGKSNPNTVTDEDKEADCTMTVSVETFEAMKSGEIDGTSAFMQGKLKVSGDMSIAMKLASVMGVQNNSIGDGSHARTRARCAVLGLALKGSTRDGSACKWVVAAA